MDKAKAFIHNWAWILLVIFTAIGFFYPVIGFTALFCMLGPVISAFFKGRMWCGNFCPRGSFNDIVLSKISRKKPVPSFLKSKWTRVSFLLLLTGAFTVQMILGWKNASSIGLVFVRMIFVTTLIAIILGILFKPRNWCMICPMGTLANFAAGSRELKPSLQYVTFDGPKCVNCKLCSKACIMEIDVLKYKEQGKVLHADCLKCPVCIDKCPKKALGYT